MIEIEEIENEIAQVKKSDLDMRTKEKVLKELENKKYILEQNK